MATLYPSGTDGTTQLPNIAGTNLVSDVNYDHALVHTNVNGAVIAIEAAIGSTAGTSVLKNFAAGDFATRINSGGTFQQNVTIGSSNFNNGTIGSVQINTGTVSFPTLNVSSDAQGDVYYRSAGGALARLGAGANGQFLQTQGASANPQWAASMNFSTTGTIATGTTASASFVDVVGGSVTINPTRTVTVQAIATGRIYGNAAGNINPQLVINGTAIQNYDTGITGGQINQGIPFSISGQASVPSGAIVIKLQFKTSAGTMSMENSNLSIIWG